MSQSQHAPTPMELKRLSKQRRQQASQVGADMCANGAAAGTATNGTFSVSRAVQLANASADSHANEWALMSNTISNFCAPEDTRQAGSPALDALGNGTADGSDVKEWDPSAEGRLDVHADERLLESCEYAYAGRSLESLRYRVRPATFRAAFAAIASSGGVASSLADFNCARDSGRQIRDQLETAMYLARIQFRYPMGMPDETQAKLWRRFWQGERAATLGEDFMRLAHERVDEWQEALRSVLLMLRGLAQEYHERVDGGGESAVRENACCIFLGGSILDVRESVNPDEQVHAAWHNAPAAVKVLLESGHDVLEGIEVEARSTGRINLRVRGAHAVHALIELVQGHTSVAMGISMTDATAREASVSATANVSTRREDVPLILSDVPFPKATISLAPIKGPRPVHVASYGSATARTYQTLLIDGPIRAQHADAFASALSGLLYFDSIDFDDHAGLDATSDRDDKPVHASVRRSLRISARPCAPFT
ncbi:hypothetical protein FVE85_6162 [Porphyridium purpureum]|uniref:Uncharacterized protein n=1 Tax=Porphyridium purpureum TaxID=35688 RepID=A0A5J4Z7F1_PORPP|nr:hypothetical protein FVE85_6162 [Porphyridium purpureum]|eukprot:POR5387..scf295_1